MDLKNIFRFVSPKVCEAAIKTAFEELVSEAQVE